MQNYMRTILSALQTWINKRLKETVPETDTAHQQFVTDADGNAVWEERTHYEEFNIGLIWKDAAPALFQADDEAGVSMFASAVAISHKPIDGKEYTITHNGVASTHICRYLGDANEAYWMFGNYSLMFDNVDTGEKFIIMIPDPNVIDVENDGIHAIVYDLTNMGTGNAALTSVTMSVEGLYTDVHKLDEKYLTETIARISDVEEMIDTALGVIENGTY